ncbi:MAG: PorV/PorQ family protein [Elusimicrobiota bacterium]
MGSNAKIVNSTLGENYSANTVAFDFGIIFRTFNDRFSFGFSMVNMGDGLKYKDVVDDLPTVLRTGLQYKPLDLQKHNLTIAEDVLLLTEDYIDLRKTHFGFEYWFQKLIALRVGYKIGYEPNIFTAGVGVKAFNGQLDYGYVSTLDELTHKISFTLEFGSDKPYNIGEKYYAKKMPNRAVYYYSQVDKTSPEYRDAADRTATVRKSAEEVRKERERLRNEIAQRNQKLRQERELKRQQEQEIKNQITEVKKILDIVVGKGVDTSSPEKLLKDAQVFLSVGKYEPAKNNLDIAKQQLEQIQQQVAEKEVKAEIKKPVMLTNLAVADFVGKNVSAADASIVAGFLRTEIVKLQVCNVIEKANMDKILAEAAFQQTGCTTSECAVQIGKLLNVKQMVVGDLSKLMDTYFITVNLVEVETGKILKSETVKAYSAEELQRVCVELAKKITQ